MKHPPLIPASVLSLLIVLSLLLAACGETTANGVPSSTIAAATTAPGTTTAVAKTVVPTTFAPTLVAATTAASTRAAVIGTSETTTAAPANSRLEFVRKVDTRAMQIAPTSLALDSQGNLYTFDYQNYNIVKLDPNGKVLTKWGKKGAGEGEFLIESGHPEDPKGGGLAVDKQGTIYFADTYNHRIQKFDSEGHFLANWSNPGIGDGQFSLPSKVVLDNQDNFYIEDYSSAGNPVQKFDHSGIFLAKIGSRGAGEGQISSPNGLVVDSQGNIYISDLIVRNGPPVDAQGNPVLSNITNRIKKFDSSGKFLSSFGSTGDADGQLIIGHVWAVDSKDNLYVGDEIGRLNIFDKAGKFIGRWSGPGNGDAFRVVLWVVLDGKGNLYLCDPTQAIYQLRLKL